VQEIVPSITGRLAVLLGDGMNVGNDKNDGSWITISEA
jgi:hypothetical protein